MQTDEPTRILLVEDQAIIALAQKSALQKIGYDVEHLGSGEDAVARLNEDESFDLVLMDIDLGQGIDGPEAAQRILSFREIPIVFLTAHAEQEMVDRVRRITRYGYVLKSSGDFVLRGAIEMALELFTAHKQTRRELARNEAILHAIPDLYFVMTRSGTFVEARSSDPGRLAVPPERVAGLHLRDLFPPEEVERHLLHYRRCHDTGEPQRLEYTLETGDSRQIYEARLIKLDEEHLLAISRDVTEDRERERKDRDANHEHLIRKMDFLKLVARVSRDFMRVREEIGPVVESTLKRLGLFFRSDRCYLVEITQEDTLQGQYEWTAPGVDSTIERIDGTPAGEFPWILDRLRAGETVQITNAADLPPEASGEREMLLSRNVISALFIPLVTGERTEGYLGFHVTQRELSWTRGERDQMRVLGEILARALSRKRTLAALARERLLVDVLMDRSPDYIYFKDSESRFLRASKSMALFHGREDPRELIGLTDLDRMSESDARVRFEQEQEIMNTGIPLVDLEEQDRLPDGSICWHSTTKSPLYDEQGEILGIFGISRDITERKAAREKLASYSREQELLLRELHHRVRNTMNTMRSLISLHGVRVSDEKGREII
jgi:PAS domain S-box-containing protein